MPPPSRLRCEYRKNPLGIDLVRPRLSWCIGDERPAELQTAYHLLAASHPDLLAMDEGDLWDTGRVEGRETSQIEYNGKQLISARSVWWKVRSYDSDGLPSSWSTPAFFEAGLLLPEDWQGRWIRSGLQGSRITPASLPLFAREFELPAAVRTARLYVATLGQVALQLNGTRIGNAELAPNWVDYSQRVEYLTFDVTGELTEGANRLAVLLADGWYAGDPGTGFRQQYGAKPALLVQLNVTCSDGQTVHISSDGAWRWQPSWILASDPSTGEQLDGTRLRADWLDAGPGASGWYPVESGSSVQDLGLEMSASSPTCIRSNSDLDGRPIRWQPEICTLLFEFPHTVMGRVQLTMIAPDGGAVRVRYGMSLDLQGALVSTGEDVCVAAGDEAGEIVAALFSLHGFRYVEVSGDVYREDAVTVSAVSIGQPLPGATTLVSDQPRLNRLHDATLDHLRMLQQAIPMAGPAPADRVGDVASFGAMSSTLLLNLESTPLVIRWLRDMVDAQFPTGAFPTVVPAPPAEEALCGEGPAGASAAFVEVLWQLYRHTGDRRLVRRFFPAVKQMVSGAVGAARDFIRDDLEGPAGYPADLAATAWLYRSARLAARLSGVLGNLSDLEDFEELAANVRNAFRRRFVTPDGRVIGDGAAVYVMALGMGLLDRAERRSARRALADIVDGTLGTADADTLLRVPALLPVLCEFGRLDLAYRLVLETPLTADPIAGTPGTAELIKAGVQEWLFGTLSGFGRSRDLSERHNAYRHLVIRPRPPLGVGFEQRPGEPPVRAVEAALSTINGRYESSWRITEEAFEMQVRVPGNCTARIVLPDGVSQEVAAGAHELRMPFGEAGDGIPVLREVS